MGAEVSLVPIRVSLPLAQNNLHTREARLGAIHSEPLQSLTKVISARFLQVKLLFL